jgi:hypothetical protein
VEKVSHTKKYSRILFSALSDDDRTHSDDHNKQTNIVDFEEESKAWQP